MQSEILVGQIRRLEWRMAIVEDKLDAQAKDRRKHRRLESWWKDMQLTESQLALLWIIAILVSSVFNRDKEK